MTHFRNADTIAAEIRNWDMADIRVLRDLISEINALRDEHGDQIDVQSYIDGSDLPTADIPADIDTSYPVWAVDESGLALTGDDMTEIETLDEIRKAQL